MRSSHDGEVQGERGWRYQFSCSAANNHYGKRNCQCLSGQEVDLEVSEAFFDALHPAEIDALERHTHLQATASTTNCSTNSNGTYEDWNTPLIGQSNSMIMLTQRIG